LKSGQSDSNMIVEHLDEMEKAYRKIVAYMAQVRNVYWDIQEVSDGLGGTIFEINEKT
jgi:hypothetical protein